jgi:hypothetical protein
MQNSTTQNTTQHEVTTYSDMIKKENLSKMLGLEAAGPWEVVSETDNGLSMVHYTEKADLNIFGSLRGVVVDTNNGTIVCYSYPHATKIVTSSLSLENGKLRAGDYLLNPETTKIKIGFEGTLLHVFKHAGKVYRSTRKRFDASKSRWGNSKTFGDIYAELEGPKDEDLFDPTKDYSPYCHTFILVHPDLLICTRDNVGKGYLVYLGPKQMYSPEADRCPYPIEKVDVELRVPNTSSSLSDENKKIYAPELLTLDEANKHLKFGFYDEFEGSIYLDPRLLPGEFLILEDTENKLMYRVESNSYNWRSLMRNNNPNLLHRFYELIDFSYLKNAVEEDTLYTNMFPLLTLYDFESLSRAVTSNPIVVWPQNTEKVLSVPTTRDAKMYNIWQTILISMPLSKQNEIIHYYNILQNRKNEVIMWLNGLSSKSDLDLTKFSKRVQDILTKTKTFAVNKARNEKTKKLNVESLTRENIRNFISKELGSSLYRITREMDRYNNPV